MSSHDAGSQLPASRRRKRRGGASSAAAEPPAKPAKRSWAAAPQGHLVDTQQSSASFTSAGTMVPQDMVSIANGAARCGKSSAVRATAASGPAGSSWQHVGSAGGLSMAEAGAAASAMASAVVPLLVRQATEEHPPALWPRPTTAAACALWPLLEPAQEQQDANSGWVDELLLDAAASRQSGLRYRCRSSSSCDSTVTCSVLPVRAADAAAGSHSGSRSGSDSVTELQRLPPSEKAELLQAALARAEAQLLQEAEQLQERMSRRMRQRMAARLERICCEVDSLAPLRSERSLDSTLLTAAAAAVLQAPAMPEKGAAGVASFAGCSSPCTAAQLQYSSAAEASGCFGPPPSTQLPVPLPALTLASLLPPPHVAAVLHTHNACASAGILRSAGGSFNWSYSEPLPSVMSATSAWGAWSPTAPPQAKEALPASTLPRQGAVSNPAGLLDFLDNLDLPEPEEMLDLALDMLM